MKKLTDEPDELALWQHPIYGARTLVNIREMDALPRRAESSPSRPVFDSYSAREDAFIDKFGFSTQLF